ncbi:MAG: lysylphosphatidylglycerol synthase domain-containing protein [candidate division WOR-3 bacterium]
MAGKSDTGKSSHGQYLPTWLKFGIGGAIVVASFYFLISRLVADWHQIPFDQLRFRPLPLAGSFALFILVHLPLYGYAWKLVLAGLGERMSFFRSSAIIAVTQLGKYVPGKVWFTLGRVSLASREGIPVAKSLVSILVETGFALLSAVLLFGLAVLYVPRSGMPWSVYLLFLTVPMCLVVTYPPILNRVLAFLLRRFRQPVFRLSFSYLRLLSVLAVYTVDWVVQGIGAFLLINSYSVLPVSALPALVAGYSVSWILGFLFLLAPAGLGIREGIYTFILDKMVQLGTRAGASTASLPLSIVSALVTRVWITASEAVLALAFASFFSRTKGDKQRIDTDTR